jgi:hypothetical protein
MENISWFITLLGAIILTSVGILKLYGLTQHWVTGSNKTLKENVCGT